MHIYYELGTGMGVRAHQAVEAKNVWVSMSASLPRGASDGGSFQVCTVQGSRR